MAWDYFNPGNLLGTDAVPASASGAANWSLDSYLDTGLVAGSAPQIDTTRYDYSQPVNALQSMATPVQPGSENSWSGFFQSTIRDVLGYAVRRDAIRSGVPGAVAPVQRTVELDRQARRQDGSGLLLLVVGVVAVMALSGGGK